MPDNISKLYSALKDTYELGSEADFRKYLGDGTKREALRKELESEYEVGDSASFSKYLGFDQQGKPAGTVKAEERSVGDMGAGVGAAILGATGKPKVAVEQQQTQQRQPKLSQMPSGFGELDIQQANRRGLGMGPGAWVQPEPGTVNPKTGKSEPKQEKNIAKQLDRALKGDKKAAKESGLDAAVQRMREEKEYYEATGKPLANIVNTPVTAPTAVRDKDGQMLMGQTTDEQRVAQYQQQEKEIARKKIIDPIVDDIQKQLEGKVPLYTSPINGMSSGPQWNAMMNQTEQLRRMNQADSPEKLWSALNEYFGLGKKSDINDEELKKQGKSVVLAHWDEKENGEDFTSKFLVDNQDAIQQAASRLGMNTDDFVWQELIPKMSETIAKRFNENMSEKYSVKSTADYIAKRMINSSVGALARMGTMTTQQSQLMQEELEKSGRGEGRHFNAAWYDKAVGEVAQFLPDTPLMVIGGTIGGAATKGLGAMITRAGAEGLGTMVSTGSPFLAANVGKMVKWGGLLGHSVVSGAANMGSFMGMSSMLQAMASTPVDDGYLSSVGMAGWEGIKEGAKIGTALGVLGTASGAGSGLWKTAKGRAAWAGGTFLAENQIFALSDYLADPEKFNWVDSSLDAFYMQMAGKVQGMATHGTEGIKNSWRQIFKPMPKMPTLTETEKAQIQRAFGGMSFEEIAGDMGNLEKILKDKQNIPLTIRQKISGRVLGVFEPNRPFTYNINIRGKEIYERSKEGELLQVHTFETPDERDAIMQEIADRKQHDQMAHDFIALDMKEQAAPILDSFAQEFGMTRQELWDMMQKKPIELVEDEYDLMQELGRRLHEAATPKGELHSAQSNTDGAELAGGSAEMNPDTAAAIAQEVTEAKEAYENFPLSEDLRTAVYSLGDARLDDIYMYVRNNFSGTEVDEYLKVVADYANAKAKQQGYIDKTGMNIDEQVAQDVDEKSFHGTIDNVADDGNIITITKDGEEFVLLNGSVGTRDGASVDPERSGGMIIARTQDGRWVSMAPDALMTISSREPKDAYAERVREQLQMADTQTAVETGLVEPEMPKTEGPGPKESNKDMPGGVLEGPALTPAGEPHDTVEGGEATEGAVSGTDGESVGAVKALSKIPTLKDEQGNDVLDEDGDPQYQWDKAPLNDTLTALVEISGGDRNTVTSTVDVMLGEAQKELEKAEKLTPKGKDPIKIARNAAEIKAQQDEARRKLEYWTAAKQELEKVNKAESELKDEPAKDNEPENVVPLQPQAASEQQKPSLKSRLQTIAERYKKKFGEFFNDDIDVPGDATELVALNIGTGRQFRWDDKPNGAGGVIRGFKTALGINTEFGGRRGSEGHAFAHLFKGKDDTTGLGFDEFVDKVWRSDENTIHGLDGNDTKRFTEQQIGDAIIDLFMSAEQGKDITEYIIRNRVEKAQKAWEAEQARLKEEAERNERIELTDEEQARIDKGKPFGDPTEEDFPELPKSQQDKLVEEVSKFIDPDVPASVIVIDSKHTSDKNWYDITSEAYGGIFPSEEDITGLKDWMQREDGGYFFADKTGKLYLSDHVSPDKAKELYNEIKEAYERTREEAALAAADSRKGETDERVDDTQREDRTDEGRAETAGVDDHQGEGRSEPVGEPKSSERDEYLKPRNEKEEKVVSDVEAKLAEEIKAAEEEVKKAKSAYEKARAKESDKATDMFSDDKAFEKPDQLFSFDEMGGTDRTQEGVNRRTEEVRERLIDAQAKLDRLQSQAEHDSRVRGALDNERRQTSFEEDDVFTVTTKKNGSVNVLDKNIIPEGRATNEDYEWLYNEFNKLEGKWDEKTGWTFPKEKAEAVEDILGQFKERISKEPSDNPMEAIEKASTEFKEEKKAEQKELGITTDETPEQKADRERAEKLADTPLTDAEVDSSSASDVQKTLAKAYLNGNHGLLQEAAYLNVYNDVRNTRRTNEGDSQLSERGTQLVSGENQPEQRPGRVGGEPLEVAQTESKGARKGQDQRPQQRVEDSEGRLRTGDGERGDSRVSESEPVVDSVSSGHILAGGGDRHSVTGTELGERRGGGRGNGDTQAAAAGSDAAIAASKQRLAELRKRFKKAGRNGELSISLVGMNNEQIGILGEIITESANLGYQYIAKGLHEFNEWKKQMWEDFHDWLHEDMKWTDAEIDEYMQEVWNCQYNINGVTRTIGEWASFIGQEKMREVVREDLSTKFEKQKAAESVETKVGDIDNIRESLPYLLPEQQDDVLKAETQFFNGQHQDRQHGFGKGMMFTNGTGTGKTYTGLGIVKRFVKQGKGRVLILTPSQEKVSDWRNDGLNLGLNIESLDEEAKIKGTSATKAKGKGVVVTTYANARQNLAMLEDCFDLIVYDESHKIMESKEATNTTMMDFHEMLTNKNVERSMDRQTYWLPEWIEHRNLLKEQEETRAKLDELSNESSSEAQDMKQRLNARMMEIQKRFEELRPIMQEIRESKRPQAEIDSKRTKTVFLSATPFNQRKNLRYAEGYIFSYPEEDRNTIGTYNHRSPEDAFLEQTFPAGYRWRYGRLEEHTSNQEALGRQEIDFSDYLQNNLGTMSGRMIASDYDYSRDFPVLTLDHAGRFNQAMSEVYRNKRYQPLAEAFRKSFDYNYSTALFEAMKTSLVNERIKEHLARGQKVVVFHRRRTSADLEPPFRRALDAASVMASMEQDGKRKSDILSAIAAFEHDFADMLEWEKTLDYTLPREQIERRFGKDNVAFFSGVETKGTKHKSVDDFMKDNGGKDIIVVQEASGKEGISLHDKTGEHQRVEINLALPQSPIAFIQIEGRIYRIGQQSNAIFEYPLLGLDLETNLFAQKFNNALGTTENLALGSKARNLRKSIANSILENTGEVDYDRQGLGGKDMDGRVAGGDDKDGFDVSIQDYYGNQKMQRGRDNREDVDYFPTPEPIGYKMVEWGQMMEGETALEPSAGHGAIARYVPETNGMTAIEPSSSLFTKLQMRAGGPGRRFEEMPFENYPLGNKHDVVLMNPPYGVGGKTAMEHVAKAFRHLNEGGRVIAIIPDGPAMEKRLDAWLNGDGETAAGGAAVVTGEVKLPSVAFGRAGTNVRTRIVVIDKVSRAEMRQKAPQKVTVDLSGEESIAGLFDRIRNVRMPERTIDQVAINTKKALRTKRALEDNPFTSLFEITRDGYLRVRSKSRYDVSEIWLNLENPRMEDVLIWYKNFKETMENPEGLEYGKYKHKIYGTGKNKVPALDAIKDYCQQAIKTLENVTGMTADQMDKAVREQEAERERKRQEREAEYQRQREERARQEREKLDAIKRNIEEGFTGEGIYNDVEQLKRMVDLYHSRRSGLFEKRRAKFNLEQAGFDPETGKKIDNNEPVNARTSTVVQPTENAAGTVATQRKADYEYKLDKNTRTGEDMHLVSYNGARLSDNDYRAVERKAKALGGYYNRFKKAFHFKTAEEAQKFAESLNGTTQEPGTTTRFRLREKEAPKKTQKVYKLMRLGDDGKLYPLFIDAAAPTELGKWYDADSPDLSILQKMPSGTFLVDYKNGTYTSMEDYAKEHGMKMGKYPSKEAVNDATSNGLRWVRIEDTGRSQRRYGGESRKYMNLGINGSGTVSEFAMRPGWHAGSLPSMRQIGKGKDRNLRDDRFVWVEGEVPADREWQSIADQNPDKDIPTQIPEDGFYMKATNANKAASQADRIGWYVAGAFKANRIMSDVEARNVITKWNKEHPDQPVEYDFERESGKDFNAETMQLEDGPTTRFRSREADEDGRFDFDKPIRLKEKGISKDLKDIKANKWNLPEKIRDIVAEKLEKYMSDKDGEVQDVDVKPYFGEKGETTAKDALEYISNNSTDEGIKKLASYLLKNIGDNGGVSVKFSENRTGSRGKYYSNNHSVSIRRSAARGADEATAKNNLEQTVIHEIAHAITVRAIENSPEVRKEFLQIYKDYEELREQYGINTGYAAKNPKEFVAEFLGRKAFREALMEIPSNEKGKTFGQKVLDFIKKHILRIKETDTFFKQADDAIKKVMDMANKGDYPYVDEVAEDSTTRFRFAKDKEEFDKIREDAVRSKGLVVKGLNDADISITHVDNHEFGDKPIDKARDWANKNLVTSEEDIKNNKLPKMKDGTPYVISKNAIGKYLSKDGMASSDSKDVHLSVLKRLKDVISESIEAEVHPDYPKIDGVRTTEKYNDNALIHRLYGAVEIDGKVYRVKTTMQEFRGSEANKPHSYEVTKIELLDSPMTASESPSVNVGQHKTDTKESTNNSISGAKLLKDVEKSYDSGKKLLDESEKSTFFRKGEPSQTPLETDYRRKEEAGRKLAKKLNSDFEAVTELDQIQNKEVRDAIAAGHEVPGWIEIGKDGKKKIFMYLPHVRDTYDAEKTIAHETIGHQGLRELLGEKGYKSYCQSLLYDLKDPELQKYWTENLAKNGFDTYRTIDEFLAEAAEKGYGDLSMWQKVKNAMTDALRSAGFTMSPSISDVKYMVWLSKHNLEKGNVMNQVEREAILFRLGRERYEAKVKNGEFTYEGGRDTTTDTTRVPYFPGEGKTLFRHTPSVKNQRMNYERSLKRIGYVWKEAHIDAMQSAIELMRSISGVKKIEDIPSAENFVLLENQMSSKEEQIDFRFYRDYMKPLDDAIGKCLPDMGNGVDEQLRNLQLYMIKKHGLERNRVLFVRDAIRALRKDSAVDQKQVDDMEQDYFDTMRGLRDDLRNGNIDLREYFEEVDKWIGHNMPEYKVGEKDYSGLSSMGKPSGAGVGYDDAGIIDEVMSTESMLGKDRVDGLWEKTKAVSQFGLDMEYEGGLDSKEKHDKVSEMFEWYVPLRGYDEKTAEEVYDYLEEGGNDRKWAGPVLMNAKGRESLADVDVFATLGAMSGSAINRSLRNQMKQAFARFVRSHYNEVGADQRLVTELPYLWAEKQYDPVTGQDVWVEKFPDIPEGAKADDVAAILDQYQQDMEVKEANGNAKRVRQNSNIPFRPADKAHKAQHIVDVWINGEKHSFVVNGNPRAAQAINGQLKAERNSNILWLSSLSHFMAKMNTSYSPDFIMRNTERDLIYSAANIAVKENAEYWLRWAKNYGVAIGRVASGVPAMHTNLFKRYREGTLNMANATDRYFKEFMENGGETGWVERKNLDKWKKAIKEGVSKDSTPEKVGKVVINALPDAIEAMNERAENMARFATYMTSREMGRTITRSVSDAKEVSVNFNRKGAGKKTVGFNKGDGSWLSNANAYMAGWSAQNLQDYIMFYNAGVQGMTNMIKNVANHPIKGATAFAFFALAGMLMPQLNQYLFEEDDDKTGKEPENPYAELPEYVRRNNLCIYNGKGSFITIALPIELRAMYGIGDMAASYINHPELRSTKNMGEDIVTQLSQVAPLDFFGEGAGPMWAMVPSGIRPFAEAAANKNWLGQPIERDEERWNKNKPRWTRAFKNVGDAYVGASKRLNAATNPYHDENIKGWADGAITDPALVEHIVNGYFGGVGSTVNRVAQLAKHANEMSPKEAITSNWMPIVRTQHYTPNERTRYARTRNKWWYYKEEADKTQETIKVLKKRGEEDPMSYMKSVSEKEGKKGSRAMIMAEAYKRYSAAKKALENTDDLQEKNLYQLQMDQIMEETVKKLEKIK